MKHLFSSECQRVVEALGFTKTLYAFDFDGTLSPIVSTPERARASRQTEELLRTLSSYAPVAIISGRSVADLRKRLNFVPKYLIGNHGLEGLRTRTDSSDKAKKTCQNWRSQLRAVWNGLSEDPGVFIENKTFSLAAHYRRSRNKKIARMKLIQHIESLTPSPRMIFGKSVINLIPSGAPHKGIALLELMTHLGVKSSLYVGDDDTDEDVFSLPDSRIVSVRVAKKRSSQAQYFLNRQTEVNRLIRSILAGFERGIEK